MQDAFFFRNLAKHFFFKVLIAFYLMILYNDTGIKRSFDTYDSWEFTFDTRLLRALHSRNLHIIALKELHHDSWEFTFFVL